MSALLRVIDLETTGLAPPHEIVEIGITDVMYDPAVKSVDVCGPVATLYRPTIPIPAEARAVHHLSARHLDGWPPCMPEDVVKAACDGTPFALVAHNAAMETQWLTPDLIGKAHWIDTLKCAKRLWVDAPGFSNQVLRYWLEDQDGLPDTFDADLANQAHRAGPDTYVTAHLLAAMLREQSVKQLVIWTLQPTYYHLCPLGKFRHQPWDTVEAGFLKWMVQSAPDLDKDVKAAAADEINRRQGARR